MHLKYIIASLLIVFYSNVSGQTDNWKYQDPKPGTVGRMIGIRFNVTGLADFFDQNISFGGEYKFAPLWSAGTDVGYVFHSNYLSESKFTSGIILRPFIRYYLDKDGRGFLEGQIHYKKVSYEITDWIGRDVSNGVPAYEEYTSFKYRKRVFDLRINIGDNVSLSRDEKLMLEPYIGIGVRFKKQGVDGSVYQRGNRWLGKLYDEKYSSVVLPLGLRLVYQVR